MIYIFDKSGYRKTGDNEQAVRLDIELHNRDNDDLQVMLKTDEPEKYIYDSGQIRVKTLDEQLADEIITQDEYDNTIAASEAAEKESQLAQSDQSMIRGIDDLITLLINKQIITESELPAELAKKLKSRAELRESLNT